MDTTEKHLQILTNETGSNAELLNIKIPPGDGDIVVQLDLINEQDDNSLISRQSSINSSINFDSPTEIFQTILQMVAKTPNEIKFLNILQHLLCIDPNKGFCNDVWDVAEKLLHRIVQVENSEDAQDLLLKTTENPKQLSEKCVDNKQTENTNQQLIATYNTLPIPDLIALPPSAIVNSGPSGVPPVTGGPPPPPPPSFGGGGPPPPPPLFGGGGPPPPPPLFGGGPPPPPPLFGGGGTPPPPPLLGGPAKPKQNIPKPTKKLKIFNWTKIPPLMANKSNTIWFKLATLDHQYKCNYQMIEELFNSQISTKDEVDRGLKVDSNKPIQLLNSQFSLQINIFLSQFKSYKAEDIIQLVYTCNNKIMDLDKLKDLIKFLSKEEDLAILQLFDGDRQRLGNAEKFLISLMEIPNYKLRIDFMVFKENFNLNMNIMESAVKSIFEAGNYLIESETLLEIFHIILTIGNYLNYGNFVGNATGISISSLNKISDTKANKPNMHLLHFLVMEVEKHNQELINFYQDFNCLAKVARLNIIQIGTDIDDLKTALDTLIERLKAQTTNVQSDEQELQILHNIMDEFLQEAEHKLNNFRQEFEELKTLHRKMAEYFCENVEKFSLDEFFIIFHKFCEEFKKSLKESKEIQEKERRDERRRKLKEEELAKRSEGCHTFPMKSHGHRPRRSLNDINTSFIKAEANKTNIELNSTKNENDLMAYLENSKDKCSLKKLDRIAKRSSLKISDYQRERDLCPFTFQDISKQNPLAEPTENLAKPNVMQKSWKRLMDKYKATKCLTPDVIPPRQSLQILIRSNSTVDSKTGQLRKKASIVKITKTPLPQTQSVFNFQPTEIKEYQETTTTNKIQEIGNNSKCKTRRRPPSLTLNISKITNEGFIKSPLAQQSPVQMRHPRGQLCRRLSYINDEDLKETRKGLRTPTIEGTNMCFSPIHQKPCTNFLAFSPTLSKPKKIIEEQWNGNANHKETFEIAKDNLKVNITLGSQENDIQQHLIFREQDTIEEQPETPELKSNNTESFFENQDNILEENTSFKSENLKSEDSRENLTPEKRSFSKLIVAKFQKAFSRPSSVENLSDEFRITDKFKRSRTITEPSDKPNFSQRLIKGLRALSPLKIQSLDDGKFQSYVKQNSKEINHLSKEVNQQNPTQANEKEASANADNKKPLIKVMVNVKSKSNIEKVNLTKENSASLKVTIKDSLNKPNTSKTLKTIDSKQQRVNLRSSLTSTRRSTNSLNSLQSKTSKTSSHSSTESKQRRFSLQHSRNSISSNSSKNIDQRRSSLTNTSTKTSKEVSSKTSSNSSAESKQRRSSLQHSRNLISSNSSKNIEQRRSSLTNTKNLTSTKTSKDITLTRSKVLKSSDSSKLKSSVSSNSNKSTITKTEIKRDSLKNPIPLTSLKITKSTQQINLATSANLKTTRSATDIRRSLTTTKTETKRDSLKNPITLKSLKITKSTQQINLATSTKLKATKSAIDIRKSLTNTKTETKQDTSTLPNRSSLTSLKPLVNTRLTRRSSLSATNSSVTSLKLSITRNSAINTRSVIKKETAGEKAKTSSTHQTVSIESNMKRPSLTNSILRKTPLNSSTNSKRASIGSTVQKPLANIQQRRSSVPSNNTRRTSITSTNSLSLKQNRNSTGKTSPTATGPSVSIRKNTSTSQQKIAKNKDISEEPKK